MNANNGRQANANANRVDLIGATSTTSGLDRFDVMEIHNTFNNTQ